MWFILWFPDSESKSQLAPASCRAKQFLNKIPEVIKSLGKKLQVPTLLSEPMKEWNVSLYPEQMTS